MESLFFQPRGADPDPWARLASYLAGYGSPEDRRDFEVWLRADPGRWSAFERIRDEWNAKPVFPEVADIDADWAALSRSLSAVPMPHPLTPVASDRTAGRIAARPRARWIVAGSVAAGVVLALFVFFAVERRSHGARAHATTYQTAPGQRTTVSLADGSVMALAPATTVRVTADRVVIDGEASFTIAARSAHPLVVQTRNVAVQVLGTQFWVRQYPADAESRVVVSEGKVGLRSLRMPTAASVPAPRTVLSARMMAQISDSGIVVTSGIATEEYTGGTTGTLVFRHVPLRDVAVELSRGYGVDVRVADSVLAQEKILAEVDLRSKSLPQVLDFICVVMNAHYVSWGKSYVVLPGRSREVNPPAARPEFRHPLPEKQYGR